MRVFVDLDTNQMVVASGVMQQITSLNLKRSPYTGLEVQFSRRGVVTELDNDAVGIWGLKKPGKYDDDYVTAAPDWIKTGSGESTVYTFVYTLITGPLDALFNVDGNPDNDVKSVPLMGELQWSTGGNTFKTPTIVVNVANDVNRGGETIPNLPPIIYGVFLPSITELTGGTPTDLDGIPTVGLLTGMIIEVLIDGAGEREWLTFELGEYDAGPGVVEPVDYDAVTNNRRWKGAVGPSGPAGSKWRKGSGVPSDALGLDDDFYIDSDTGDVYVKDAGSYGITFLNIKGPPGDPGEPGEDGADSTVPGPAGEGVPPGGDPGQILAKATDASYDTEWVDPSGGSGGGIQILDQFFDDQATSITDAFEAIASFSIPANTLVANGDQIRAKFFLQCNYHATALRGFKVEFAIADTGYPLFETGAGTSYNDYVFDNSVINNSVVIEVRITRRSSSSIIYCVELTASPSSSWDMAVTPNKLVNVSDAGDINFASANDFELFGKASGTGAGSGDIVAKMGCIEYIPA